MGGHQSPPVSGAGYIVTHVKGAGKVIIIVTRGEKP